VYQKEKKKEERKEKGRRKEKEKKKKEKKTRNRQATKIKKLFGYSEYWLLGIDNRKKIN